MMYLGTCGRSMAPQARRGEDLKLKPQSAMKARLFILRDDVVPSFMPNQEKKLRRTWRLEEHHLRSDFVRSWAIDIGLRASSEGLLFF